MEDQYYILNKCQIVGNCATFWAVDGHGYTTSLEKALKVPLEKAKKLCEDRPKEDFYLHAIQVVALAEVHFDVQKLDQIKNPLG